MTTRVERSIDVGVPVSTAYNQWTQFEEFPHFMAGVEEVRQLDDRRLHWVARIAGVRREWDATVLEQVPDEKVAWAATDGVTNAGAVYFQRIDADRTRVLLCLEYEPDGLVEKAADRLHVVARQAEADLERFRSYLEARGTESGAWRGSIGAGRGVGTPGVALAGADGDSDAVGRTDG
ncbi:SRPBCC family protein [Micromonospora matsumotoense]|uniref:SRPBCC family protein n=1 Tax=Micromonospora matsumotoense TaxID=121616 RepID=UPI0033ECFEAF